MSRRRLPILLWLLWGAVTPAVAQTATGEQPSATASAATTGKPITIVDLQTARRGERADLRDPDATLVHLNPAANAWFLLTLQLAGSREPTTFHLENADPANQQLRLDAQRPGMLVLSGDGTDTGCVFWPEVLEQARRTKLPYAPICGGRLYLRNQVAGSRSTLEATTQFLRDHVWSGEKVIGFVRREFFRDAFVERAEKAPATGADADREGRPVSPPASPPAATLRDPATPAITAGGLGIALAPGNERLVPGRWAPAAGLAGVFISVAPPGVLASVSSAARPPALDAVEADALAFMVAFDLGAFDLGFALGTDHPRLGWSPRAAPSQRDPRLAGPDGIDSADPLVRVGTLSPALQPRVVATFTGGFKREHGAFRAGALAAVNNASHYGFVEQGVLFSRLVPGLATVYVLNDGTVGMKTWQVQDAPLLGRIRHARQNGVPLVERDPGGGPSVAGPLVSQWGAGNWSGSADEKLRTLRAGTCLIERDGRRFLVYGYFSSATPRAMAHAFQAYGCSYAMHLDMNALEHTYLALYPRSAGRVVVEHLVQGMSVLDKGDAESVVPRFLGFADNRDFFYLFSRERAP